MITICYDGSTVYVNGVPNMSGPTNAESPDEVAEMFAEAFKALGFEASVEAIT